MQLQDKITKNNQVQNLEKNPKEDTNLNQ